MTLPQSFGWIGLGAMGYPMAMNLRKRIPTDSILLVNDVDRTAVERFIRESSEFGRVVEAATARDVAEQSSCVFTMVPEGRHVKDVFLTPGTGILAANTAGKLLIDCSTIDRASSIEVAEAVKASSAVGNPTRFYDAPVSGGTLGAAKATLTFMVGIAADDPNFPVLRELLALMGGAIHPMGGQSLGLAAKLSNNYISSLNALSTAEGMNLAIRLGLDPKVFSNVMKTSSGGSYANSVYNPVPGVCPEAPSSKGYEGGFKIQLMKKDVGLAIDAARQVDAKVVLGLTGLGVYSAASEDPRFRDKDARIVYRWLGGIEPKL
ncbi:3-hydroxyisobutyrate dehydrogenase-related [Pleurotus pulmonarius]|nr:hypothetical protein EYR38_006470 [Pleurotus pulmonarius]